MRALLLALLLSGCAVVDAVVPAYRDTSAPIASKAVFEPERYLGLWYEVARFPVFFEQGCVGVTAEYGRRDDGLLSVLNICRNADGSERSRIAGTAEIVGPGRLKVRFPSVPFGAADYWVLWTDPDYRTAVVGVPNGRAGWILNRTPDIRADRLNAARDVLVFNGYDINQLIEVPQ
ncbi:lipocalin family protein [Yoonia sp.]|uniref:lipocalin family protein n=1 Tax=Yoonia sp. TaxID=2212373 RepID=UPI0019DC6424|nr:lipocalin family protein [Yoonia sp.]MBE0412477.1 lipocalin family protein [Yoonia sp.]